MQPNEMELSIEETRRWQDAMARPVTCKLCGRTVSDRHYITTEYKPYHLGEVCLGCLRPGMEWMSSMAGPCIELTPGMIERLRKTYHWDAKTST